MMKKSPRFSKLRVENLEERTLLAVMAGGTEQTATPPAPTESTTWWVATAEDTFEGDVLSLRDALARAQSGDTVRFVPELSGGTITMSEMSLTLPYFAVQKGVTVDASDLPGGITIDANGISRVFYVYGGTDSEPTVLKGLTITGGSIANDGGGIYVASGTVTLEGCTVTGNHLSGSRSLGAGICNRGTLTVTNCIVSGNTTEGYGGGIFNSGTLTVTDTVITGNQNCGIYQNQGTVTVTDSKIAGNSADSGGGIYHSSGTLTLTNCTVSGNSAARYGGGIFTLSLSPSDISIRNSVIARNTAANDGNEIYKNSLSAVLRACNTLSSYTDWTESENCLEYDPNLPLFTDAENGDYTLAAGSQAINAGNNDFVTAETDLAGNPRIAGGIVDLGAYEYQGNGPEQLAAPTILTGNKGVYVSYGANRHQIRWNAFDNVSGYELQYSADGSPWTTVSVSDPVAVVTGLIYGQDVKYRVRALGDGVSYTDSDWSAVKVFKVCPMDINGDGDISGGDRTLLAQSWLTEEWEEGYRDYGDINGDGDIGSADRVFLSSNWLMDPEEEGLQYPAPLAAEVIFTEFASADLAVDLDMF
ncbi:MAG: right-handed parallel beta-helix repeat-containing protein [Thermoguttaceae bacterium]|nr:right-handed parallel beta-helix repeat-containing protein [Thermoguttaceae bacterium]